jgi:hypothetical protein
MAAVSNLKVLLYSADRYQFGTIFLVPTSHNQFQLNIYQQGEIIE